MDLKGLRNNPTIKYGGYSTVYTILVIVGLLVFNLLVGMLGWQFDMTGRGVFTLSQHTRDILSRLDNDVTIYMLSQQGREDPRILEALLLYSQGSDRIRLETIDAELNPAFVARFDPAGEGLRNGSVIVATRERHRAIQGVDLFTVDWRDPQSPRVVGLNVEGPITNALLFVAAGNTPVIYQLAGQGQIDLAQLGVQRRIGDQLRNGNFELRTMNLAQVPKIPDDASIVALVRPRTDISLDEAEKLSNWLIDGGKLFVAIDFAAGDLPHLAGVLATFGIGIPSAVLVDLDRNFTSGQPYELWPQLTNTSITSPLIDANYQVFTPLARPIIRLDSIPRTVTLEPLLLTSPNSFYRKDITISSLSLTSDDVPGPHPVAIKAVDRVFTTGEELTRIVVIGDVDFITLVDQINGNLDFFMNSFGWLENQEQILSIRPRITLQVPLQTTGMQKLIFGGLFVVIIPVTILILGLITWLRRRHL